MFLWYMHGLSEKVKITLCKLSLGMAVWLEYIKFGVLFRIIYVTLFSEIKISDGKDRYYDVCDLFSMFSTT